MRFISFIVLLNIKVISDLESCSLSVNYYYENDAFLREIAWFAFCKTGQAWCFKPVTRNVADIALEALMLQYTNVTSTDYDWKVSMLFQC